MAAGGALKRYTIAIETPPKTTDEKPRPPNRRRDDDNGNGALIALLVAIVLVGAGWAIAHHLAEASRIQDCMMAGRRNCGKLADP